MDRGLFVVGILLALLGLTGVALPFMHISEYFRELQGFAGIVMGIGFLLLPVSIFRDGLPAPGVKAKALGGAVVSIIIAIVLTYFFIFG